MAIKITKEGRAILIIDILGFEDSQGWLRAHPEIAVLPVINYQQVWGKEVTYN